MRRAGGRVLMPKYGCGWRIPAVFRVRFLPRAYSAADDEAVACSAGGLAPLMTSQSIPKRKTRNLEGRNWKWEERSSERPVEASGIFAPQLRWSFDLNVGTIKRRRGPGIN